MKCSKKRYYAVHWWLRQKFGRADLCENPEGRLEHSSTFHWALKKECEYDFKRENFFELCASCHMIYDYTDERRRNLTKRVMQLSQEGQILKEYPTIGHASEDIGVLRSAISNALNGRALTAGGYVWKYA